jgi:hypothetical protein
MQNFANNPFMLSVVMLTVVMLNVILLSVVAPLLLAILGKLSCSIKKKKKSMLSVIC